MEGDSQNDQQTIRSDNLSDQSLLILNGQLLAIRETSEVNILGDFNVKNSN